MFPAAMTYDESGDESDETFRADINQTEVTDMGDLFLEELQMPEQQAAWSLAQLLMLKCLILGYKPPAPDEIREWSC